MPATGGEPLRITYTATNSRDDLGDRMGPNKDVYKRQISQLEASAVRCLSTGIGWLWLGLRSGSDAKQLLF